MNEACTRRSASRFTTRRSSMSAAATGKPTKSAIPGPVVQKCVQEPGCWTWDPCCCRCVWCPGKCHTVCVQCPPRKVCKKTWVSEMKQQTINCVRYVQECVEKQVPYTICRYVSEQQQRTCTYTTCQMVSEQTRRNCTYTTCRMVPETGSQDLHLPGLPHGAGDRSTRSAPTASATWCRSRSRRSFLTRSATWCRSK